VWQGQGARWRGRGSGRGAVQGRGADSIEEGNIPHACLHLGVDGAGGGLCLRGSHSVCKVLRFPRASGNEPERLFLASHLPKPRHKEQRRKP